ncbi:MAG: MFS transporter [Pseudomonadota bacterium]
MRELLLSRLSPFKYGNFSRFYFVQTLSQIGKWSHDLARAWIVVEMFGKAGALGTLLLATAIPSMIFILYGGVLVDRVDVKRVFMFTSFFLAMASLTLAGITEFSNIQFWHLLIFGVIEGLIMAFQSPAFHTLTVRLVPREDFQQALALNSINFHLGRTLGPLLAGLLMAWQGPAAVFLFDGVTYCLLLTILLSLRLQPSSRSTEAQQESPWTSLKQGLHYLWKKPFMRYKVLQLLGAISIIFPVIIVIFRTYVTEKFQLTSEQFGYVFTWPAMGSALGSLSLTVIKPDKPLRLLILGVPGTALSLAAIPMAADLLTTCVLMSICGLAVYLSFVSLTMSLHLDVAEDYRGRMSSIIGMGFLSLGPLMSFPVGFFADWVGFELSVYITSVTYLIFSALLAFLHWKQWEA